METLGRSLRAIFIVSCAIIGACVFTVLGVFIFLGHLAKLLMKKLFQ